MKLFLTCISLIIAMLIVPPCWADTPKQTVRILIDTIKNPPHVMNEGVTINWELPGISLELLRMVANKLGLEFEYYRTVWNRGLYMIEHGDGDAIFPSSYREERAKYALYPMQDNTPDPSKAIRTYAYWLYVRKDSNVTWDGQRIEHLNNPVATGKGNAIIADLKKMGYAVNDSSPENATMLEMLLAHRVDAVASFGDRVEREIAKHPERYSNIRRMDIPLRQKNGYLMFSKHFTKKHAETMEQIWEMIRTIKASPEFEKIRQKYLSLQKSE